MVVPTLQISVHPEAAPAGQTNLLCLPQADDRNGADKRGKSVRQPHDTPGQNRKIKRGAYKYYLRSPVYLQKIV